MPEVSPFDYGRKIQTEALPTMSQLFPLCFNDLQRLAASTCDMDATTRRAAGSSHRIALEATVNRLVAGSNPARGAILKFGL
jgi:hypothetical protein